jgi:hypothetical protein
MIGGLRAGLGGVRTTAGPTESSGGTPATAPDFSLCASYGHGMTADAELPGVGSFWLSPDTDADHVNSESLQVVEYCAERALAYLTLCVMVRAADVESDDSLTSLTIVVTVDGVETSVFVHVPANLSIVDEKLTAAAAVAVDAESDIGIKVVLPGGFTSGSLRCDCKVEGFTTAPVRPPDSAPPSDGLILWLRGDKGVRTDAGKVTLWQDQTIHGQDVGPVGSGTHVPPATQPGTAGSPASVDFNPQPASGAFPWIQSLGRAAGLVDRNGAALNDHTRSVFCVVKPNAGSTFPVGDMGPRIGGPLFNFGPYPNSSWAASYMWGDRNGGVDAQWAWVTDGEFTFAAITASPANNHAGEVIETEHHITRVGVSLASLVACINGQQLLLGAGHTTLPFIAPFPGAFNVAFGDYNSDANLNCFMGQIAELLMYDYDVTTDATALAQVRAYLAAKYGIAIS